MKNCRHKTKLPQLVKLDIHGKLWIFGIHCSKTCWLMRSHFIKNSLLTTQESRVQWQLQFFTAVSLHLKFTTNETLSFLALSKIIQDWHVTYTYTILLMETKCSYKSAITSFFFQHRGLMKVERITSST